jgi:multidrug efflux system outer membrane protein
MSKPLLSGLAAACLLSACAVGPDYERPAVPSAAAFPEGKGGSAVIAADWWRGFGDVTLDGFVLQALKNNADVRVAVGRVEEASAGLADVAGAQLPSVTAGGGATRTVVSTDSYTSIPSFGRTRNDFTVGLSTTFELDFWGKLRRASEAARAQLLSTDEARLQVELAVVSSVVKAYGLVRSADAQLMAAQDVLTAREEELRIIVQRVKFGAAGPGDAAQAEVARAIAVSGLSDARRTRAQAEHLLGFLIGTPDLVVKSENTLAAATPAPPAAGLPSDLLRRRPDVVAAEQALIAANARIGYAKAAYYPTFSLTGALGAESKEFTSVFGSGTSTSLLGLNMSVPLLDFGRTAARIDAAIAAQHQAAAAYEKAVLTAFREVRDALTDVRETMISLQAATRRANAAQEAFRIAAARRDQGQIAPLEFLAARRLLAESQVAIARVRLDRLGAQVDLVKALGGARPDVVPTPTK